MTNIYMIKFKWLHCCSYSLDEFTIQKAFISIEWREYKKKNNIRDQIKSELNVFKLDLIIINYNQC
jgi:hypothetical protein